MKTSGINEIFEKTRQNNDHEKNITTQTHISYIRTISPLLGGKIKGGEEVTKEVFRFRD